MISSKIERCLTISFLYFYTFSAKTNLKFQKLGNGNHLLLICGSETCNTFMGLCVYTPYRDVEVGQLGCSVISGLDEMKHLLARCRCQAVGLSSSWIAKPDLKSSPWCIAVSEQVLYNMVKPQREQSKERKHASAKSGCHYFCDLSLNAHIPLLLYSLLMQVIIQSV